MNNPVNLEDYVPVGVVSSLDSQPFLWWRLGLGLLLLLVVVLGTNAGTRRWSSDTRVSIRYLGVVVAAFVGAGLLIVPVLGALDDAFSYEAHPLTGVIEREAGISVLHCAGLADDPNVAQYERTHEQPWPAASETMFSCTWRYDDRPVEGKLKLIPKLAYRGTSFYYESGSIYSEGIQEAQLLNADNTIWRPDVKEVGR